MAKTEKPITTQRAYTLRLRGAEPEDSSWREALWQTHTAFNRGVKAFGDWLLTTRGGLCHTLADGAEAGRRDRRVLLALSWLSVEDEHGAPAQYQIAREAVPQALAGILAARGLDEDAIRGWLADCEASLTAQIKDKAVWVNRSSAFDHLGRAWAEMTRDSARLLVDEFLKGPEVYLSPIGSPDPESEESGASPGATGDADFRVVAREWVSFNLGTGEKTDKGQISAQLLRLVDPPLDPFVGRTGRELAGELAGRVGAVSGDDLDETLDSIRDEVGWSTGRPSAGRLAVENACRLAIVDAAALERLRQKALEESDKKGAKAGAAAPNWAQQLLARIEAAAGFAFVGGRNRTGEFASMLDQALRRVSSTHTWIKRAEARRREFEADAAGLGEIQRRAAAAVEWLDAYCADRSETTGAASDEGYRIRLRAIEGWKQIVGVWSRPECRSAEDRVAAAREVQANPEIEKFGDIQLFEALAVDDALPVWRPDAQGEADPDILIGYVRSKTAEWNRRRFKSPMYRHPDPLRHPVFCEFGNSRWQIEFDCQGKKRTKPLDARGLTMGLWDGRGLGRLRLRWSSKRLWTDLGLGVESTDLATEVSRADRLGRAAAGADGDIRVRSVFGQKDWNGRLQAPRAQLERIADLQRNNHLAAAEKLRQRLRWLVTFSPQLEPAGPGIEYFRALGIRPNRDGAFFPNSSFNKDRGTRAKSALCRLPGLRVLGVDLGARFAAACAVWETLSAEALRDEIAGAAIVAGGAGEHDLYLHIERGGTDERRRRTIYRRIGGDTTPDGNAHPAPWARLDRQFLIKLQGEDSTARKASPEEVELVRRWESSVGRVRDSEKRFDTLPRAVDGLMAEASGMLRLALRRHGDRARIAYELAQAARTDRPQKDRIASAERSLTLWRNLVTTERWADDWAKHEWKRRGLRGAYVDGVRQARRRSKESEFGDLATKLLERDLAEWSATWADRWSTDDQAWGGKDGMLGELKRWIAPRGLRTPPKAMADVRDEKRRARGAARHVGGLSIERINTLTKLYQLRKAFRMRPEPDNPRKNIPEKGDSQLEKLERRLLDVRDELRQQRVRQLASRIAEAALGVGVEGAAKRPERRVFPPCHAVVIENLTRYRPDDLQTRRENRQLMQWSSAKVRDLLEEACQLGGLALFQTGAAYTSRQCSRTGRPGVRCADVPVEQYLTAPWWSRRIDLARQGRDDGKADAEGVLLADLADEFERRRERGETTPQTVRVPARGGDLFVAAGGGESGAIQADLNAAANIGLRELLDPDWPGRWWYVPCTAGTVVPVGDKVKGAAALHGVSALPVRDAEPAASADAKGRKRAAKLERYDPSYWRDPSARALADRNGGDWMSHREYWNRVRERVSCTLRRRAGAI